MQLERPIHTPPNFGQSCGSCGGQIRCDGSCSVATPANLGQSCGSCGGTITCAGGCSVATPDGLGQACGSCGGTITCGGGCSVATPANFGALCGSAPGSVQCSGHCLSRIHRLSITIPGLYSFHVFTTSAAERDALVAAGWSYEGQPFTVYETPAPGTTPLYRMRRADTYPEREGLALGEGARASFLSLGFYDVGIVGYTYGHQAPGTVPLLQLGAPHEHHYTTTWDEVIFASGLGYVYEGPIAYVGP